MHDLHGGGLRTLSRFVPNTQWLIPEWQAKYATGIPFKRSAHEASRWKPLFQEKSSIPEEALKKITGAPEAIGELSITSFAFRAILKLFK